MTIKNTLNQLVSVCGEEPWVLAPPHFFERRRSGCRHQSCVFRRPAPRDFHCGRLHVPTGTWEAPEKGMLGISHYIGVRLVLGVVDVCGHAGGVGLVVRGLKIPFMFGLCSFPGHLLANIRHWHAAVTHGGAPRGARKNNNLGLAR